jgi:hypothetical protein
MKKWVQKKTIIITSIWNWVFKMWILVSNLAKENVVILNPQKSILKMFASKKR